MSSTPRCIQHRNGWQYSLPHINSVSIGRLVLTLGDMRGDVAPGRLWIGKQVGITNILPNAISQVSPLESGYFADLRLTGRDEISSAVRFPPSSSVWGVVTRKLFTFHLSTNFVFTRCSLLQRVLSYTFGFCFYPVLYISLPHWKTKKKISEKFDMVFHEAFCFITWMPESVPAVMKARISTHQVNAQNVFLQAPCEKACKSSFPVTFRRPAALSNII